MSWEEEGGGREGGNTRFKERWKTGNRGNTRWGEEENEGGMERMLEAKGNEDD